jgi:hypothetical protein
LMAMFLGAALAMPMSIVMAMKKNLEDSILLFTSSEGGRTVVDEAMSTGR